ncbi:uncharacterized protein UTRI_06674_B [Ustilago trichophora]|uniref:Uncharacterized protein n=1 Tax=Ustilago trichophora TaxID=86804 RepID=A0A5C3EPA7_9BASI|nr:uncharacterized protein UTRI_06674_B [Ustilago trichophora]
MMAPSTQGPPHKKRRYDDDDDNNNNNNTPTRDDSFGIQSLPVATLPDDFTGEPIDGEQYLAVVRREAAAAPGVFFAEHNPYAEPSPLSPPTIPQEIAAKEFGPVSKESKQDNDNLCMPTSEWQSTFILHFKNARESLSNPPTQPVKLTKDDLPKLTNTNAWYAWIHGRPPPPTSPAEAEKQSSKGYEWRTREPSGPLLLRLSTEQILALLEAFPYWIAHRVTIPDGQSKKEDRREGEVLQPLHARWLFALLMKLDGRLVSEEISVLRTLARACVAAITLSRIRRKALSSRKKEDGCRAGEEAEIEEQRMRRDEAGAWMVVAIVTGIWGQSDLWEDARVDMRRVT